MSVQPPAGPHRIAIVDIDISFWRMVAIIIKWAFASIPAVIIISIIFAIIGAVLGLYTLIARSRMKETEAFTAAKATARPPIWPEIRRNWRSALRVIGLGIGATVCYYVWSVSAVQQAVLIQFHRVHTWRRHLPSFLSPVNSAVADRNPKSNTQIFDFRIWNLAFSMLQAPARHTGRAKLTI